MSKRVTLVLATSTLAGVLLFAGVTVTADRPAAPPPPPPAEPAADADSRSLVETLERYRTAQGSILRGSSLEEKPEPPPGAEGEEVLDFGAALQDVLRKESASRPIGNPDRSLPEPRNWNDQREFEAEVQLDGATDAALADLLREASRLLDLKSHDLESQRVYSRADRYRQLARRLRREARELLESP